VPMSTEPRIRRQGDFELRVLKDGRLVMIAPDEALLEIAAAFARTDAAAEEHGENRDAEAGKPESRPAGDR
jgi:hypothetical protein